MEQKPDIPSRHNVKNQRKIPKYFHAYQKGWHGKICNNPRSIKPNPLLPTLTPGRQVMKFQSTSHVFEWTMFVFEELSTSRASQEGTFVVANISRNITNFCSKYKTLFFNFQINTSYIRPPSPPPKPYI